MKAFFKNKIGMMYLLSALFWGFLIIAKSYWMEDDGGSFVHINYLVIGYLIQTAITHTLIKYNSKKSNLND